MDSVFLDKVAYSIYTATSLYEFVNFRAAYEALAKLEHVDVGVFNEAIRRLMDKGVINAKYNKYLVVKPYRRLAHLPVEFRAKLQANAWEVYVNDKKGVEDDAWFTELANELLSLLRKRRSDEPESWVRIIYASRPAES